MAIPPALKPKRYKPVFSPISAATIHRISIPKAAAYRPLAYRKNRLSPKPLCAFLCGYTEDVLRSEKARSTFLHEESSQQ